MSVEQGGPTPEEINAESEAWDMHRMGEEGLLSDEEAASFDYQKEMEIPRALLSEPPKISERLRQHVVSKFPPESFEPENIAGTVIHGTHIHAIRPIWLGEGEPRTGYSGRGDSPHLSVKAKAGSFNITGDCTRLDEDGFNYIHPRLPIRHPGFSPFPIFFILGKSPLTWREDQMIPGTFEDEHLRSATGRLVGMNGIVLAPDENLSLKESLSLDEKYLSEIQNGTKTVSNIAFRLPRKFNMGKDKMPPVVEAENFLNKSMARAKQKLARNNDQDLYEVAGGSYREKELYLTLRQQANYIAHCMARGVDKSKIVPIYDWDGNLLWPRKEDVIEGPSKEDEE